MSRNGSRLRRTAIAAALLAVVGCATSPTAPHDAADLGTPPASPAASLAAPAAAPGVMANNVLRVPPLAMSAQSLETSARVNGKSGRSFELGNVTVRVPKNAFPGSASIKVSIPDPAKPECHLTITPASKNNFKEPVELEFNAPDGQDLRTMVILWYDETQKMWVPIPTTVDFAGNRLTAQLQHFSYYKAAPEVVRKSGW
jgi:hypothetical protein